MEENFERVSDCLHSPETLHALREAGENFKDRIKGMIAGNIIGDMLGLTQMSGEGMLAPVRPVRLTGKYQKDIAGGGVYGLAAGSWTDDTSMLIALGESLAEKGKADPENERRHYLKWFIEGAYTPSGEAFDIGRTTRQALTTGSAPSDRESNGNGALMRSSILTAWYINSTDKELIDASGLSCSVTHAHPIAKFTNVIYNLLLKKLITGFEPEQSIMILRDEYEGLMDDLKDIFLEPEVYQTTSYCVTTLETAIWLNMESSSFEETLLKAVNMGGDADTIGAVTGAVAGAIYGYAAIPERWIRHAEQVMKKYEGLRIFL